MKFSHSALSIVTVALGAMALAQPTPMAQRTQTVNAGIVLLESDANGSALRNRAPHTLYQLDSARALKPAGLTFTNPYGPTRVNQAIFDRWNANGGSLPIGTRIGKNHAPYWEVILALISDEQIANYDLLLIPAHGALSLNPFEREKLRRFVDKGGVLWIDHRQGSTIDQINPAPYGYGLTTGPSGTPSGADFGAPVLSYPFAVSEGDLQAMQFGASGTPRAIDTLGGQGNLAQLFATIPSGYSKYTPIAGDNVGVFLAVAPLGSGQIVVTTRGIHRTLGRVVQNNGYNNNLGFEALPINTDRTFDAAARMAYNVAALSSGFATTGQSSRRTSATPVDVTAPLLNIFSARAADFAAEPNTGPLGSVNFTPGPNVSTQPALYKGLMVVSTFNRVLVFDSNPRQDLDGDGNPDDGVIDLSIGANRDLIWASAPLNGPISPPTCIEVPDAVGFARDQILVVDANGTLHSFAAFQIDTSTGTIPRDPAQMLNVTATALPNGRGGYTVAPPDGGAAPEAGPGRGPYAPAYHEGLVLLGDSQTTGLNERGRVWVVDPSRGQRQNTGQSDWYFGGSALPTMDAVGGPLTVGYIPIQDGSGGMDRVIYVPTRAAVAGGRQNPGITSLWLGAKGERPSSTEVVGNDLQVTTRAGDPQSGPPIEIFVSPGSDPFGRDRFGLQIAVVDANTGTPLNRAQVNQIFTGAVTQPTSGQLWLRLRNPALWTDNLSLRISYTLNWGVPSFAQRRFLRGSVFLPAEGVPGAQPRRIIGNVALADNGNLFAVATNQTPGTSNGGGGGLFCLQETGRGTFVLKYRWELYPRHEITLNQTQRQVYQEVLRDYDPLGQIVPILRGLMVQMTFQSGPTVSGESVYVMASATKGGLSIPQTILMAFDADPEPLTIPIGNQAGNFSITQPDMARSPDKLVPTIRVTLQPGQFSFENGVIRIVNAMSSNRDQMQNAISASQPIVLQVAGAEEKIFEPDRAGGNWSPLQWFATFPGIITNSTAANRPDTYFAGGPTVAGDTLYVGGASIFASILQNGSFTTTVGTVAGISAQVSPNDAFLKAIVPANNIGVNNQNASDPAYDRPWLKQLTFFAVVDPVNPFNNLLISPSLKWPQLRGIQSFDDFRIRYLQTALPASSGVNGVAAGDGVVAAIGDTGAWTFRRVDFLVADQGRAARFDPSGNPKWIADATMSRGQTSVNGSGNVRPLSRPTRVYDIGGQQYLVVDTEANRIARFDALGVENRSIDRIMMDPTYRVAGFNYTADATGASIPLQLKAPRDVQSWTEYVPGGSNPMSNPQTLEFWIHYLIADSGNGRLIQVVDRYAADPNTRQVGGAVTQADGRPALAVLYWHSPSNVSGSGFQYTGLARINVAPAGSPPQIVYGAGVAGMMPTGVGLGVQTPSGTSLAEVRDGNGGVVVFNGANTVVINEILLPAIAANAFFDESTGTWNSPAQPARRKKLGAVQSVTMRNIITPTGVKIAMMVTDPSGVYEFVQSDGDPNSFVVRWFLPKEAYTSIRRTLNDLPSGDNAREFFPTFARRLDSGEVLVVNGYSGTKRNGQPLLGEVIQLNGDIVGQTLLSLGVGFDPSARNLGFRDLSINFELPPIVGARGLVAPVYANRR